MQRKRRLGAVAVASACVLAGAAAGISQSSAAKSSSKSRTTHAAPAWHDGPRGFPGHGGPSVHSTDVVLNKAGTAFITRTTDSGTITAVDTTAGTVTIKESEGSVTYGTPTITVPSGSTVTLDGASSSLGALKEGDRVMISSSSEGTTVFATDSSFHPQGGGPGMMPGPGGGAPPAGTGY